MMNDTTARGMALTTVIGIDASLSCTGVAKICRDERHYVVKLNSRSHGKSVEDRMARCQEICSRVECFAAFHHPLIVIERYATCRQSDTACKLGELGSVLRIMLLRHCDKLIEVPPTRLKKFVTGKGNAPKSVMIKHVDKRWGFDTESDDEADAFGLARLGGCLMGYWEPENAAQREVIEAIRKDGV